jgi:hypothetical protein
MGNGYMSKLLEKMDTFLNEANTDNVDKTIAKLKELVNDNHHTGAVLELAKFIGNVRYEKVLKHVDEINMLLQHSPITLINFRNEMRDELIKLIEQKYGKDVSVKFRKYV